MPANMTMQRPQPRIVRLEAYQRPSERIDSQRISPHRIRQVQRRVRVPLEVSLGSRGHNPELMPMQMERVCAFVEGVDEYVDYFVRGDVHYQLGG